MLRLRSEEFAELRDCLVARNLPADLYYLIAERRHGQQRIELHGRVAVRTTSFSPLQWAARKPALNWRWFASDDLGNRYEEAGGANGLSPDGLSVNGVLSLLPLPSAAARTLHVVLGTWTNDVGDGPVFSFDVSLRDLRVGPESS